jgi:hypothetical protein
MASMVSSAPHLRRGTVVARDCMSATGREFEFMNMDAAVAKFLQGAKVTHENEQTNLHLGST